MEIAGPTPHAFRGRGKEVAPDRFDISVVLAFAVDFPETLVYGAVRRLERPARRE